MRDVQALGELDAGHDGKRSQPLAVYEAKKCAGVSKRLRSRGVRGIWYLFRCLPLNCDEPLRHRRDVQHVSCHRSWESPQFVIA